MFSLRTTALIFLMRDKKMSMRTSKETPVILMQTMTAYSIPVRLVLRNLSHYQI